MNRITKAGALSLAASATAATLALGAGAATSANPRSPAKTTDELDAAIDALVSNVFTHTAAGTAFQVALQPAASVGGRDWWRLVVENAGQPTSAAMPSGISSPDVRGRPTAQSQSKAPAGAGRGGTGLGLDIVKRTAVKAGGTLLAGPTPGGGFRVEVSLPELETAAERSHIGTVS